jgi:hypothetical protein
MRFFVFTFLLCSVLLLLANCKKNLDSKIPTAPNLNAEIKSMTVTYPSLFPESTPYRMLEYSFSQDPVARTFTVHSYDSTQFREDLYGLYHRTKTYYLSSTTPQTVVKISVRMSSQLQRAAPQAEDNFDLLFDYSPGYYFPKLITTIVYDDTLGTAIHSKTQDTVYITDPANFNFVAGGLNLMNFTYSEPSRTPILVWLNPQYRLTRYTDSSYEIQNNTPDYTILLFKGYMDDWTKNMVSLYQYNHDTLLTSLAIDVSSNLDFPNYPAVINQRKFDYHYSTGDIAVKKLFNFSGITQAITAEEWTEYITKINDKWGNNGDIPSIDAYLTNTYAYYQNICDSYSDSLFLVNSDFSKTLLTSDSYYNTIYRSTDNTITRITKTKSDGTVLRNIVLGY